MGVERGELGTGIEVRRANEELWAVGEGEAAAANALSARGEAVGGGRAEPVDRDSARVRMTRDSESKATAVLAAGTKAADAEAAEVGDSAAVSEVERAVAAAAAADGEAGTFTGMILRGEKPVELCVVCSENKCD